MKVFLSYRRSDSGYAGRLYDDLVALVGRDSVLKDLETLAPGSDFREAIRTGIDTADVVIALIGPHWAVPSGQTESRLLDSDDIVRLELELALEAKKRIVPILVSDATLPAADELPVGLQSLLERNARPFANDHWRQDLEKLRVDLLGQTGEQIGPYRLIGKLGEGGMGDVYLAEQKQPVKRRVALKVIKRGMDTKEVIARFESERQALALMDHPNISKVFDAGETARGRPYFVMEYVKGEPITHYCDKNRLDTKQRLELFIEICKGVQHAHHNAIIHRDIKPTNVLAAMQDGVAVPKIIDFGIAKAINQRLTEHTLFTELGQLIGTPDYMSPEQAEMSGVDVDTRTDVYSLGVLLYVLLTGVLPFDPHELRQGGLSDLQRRIREDEPPRPSTRVSGMGDDAGAVAKERATEPATLVKRLKGDLDWITMRALEKDRTRRYATPLDLASDIERHLRDEPVEAGPPGAGYRVQKFVRRHRVGVAFASLLAVVLVAFAATSLNQTRRIARERDRANDEASTANSSLEFLIGLFRSSDPRQARGEELSARDILDRGAERIDGEMRDRPLVQARILEALGRVYRELGEYGKAERLLLEAGAKHRASGAEQDLVYSWILEGLATVYLDLGRHEDARPLAEEALKVRQSLPELNAITLAQGLTTLGKVEAEEGRYGLAAKSYQSVLEMLEEAGLGDSRNAAATLNLLSFVQREAGDLESAVRSSLRSLQIRRAELEAGDPTLARSAYNLAILYRRQGDLDQAQNLFEEALRLRELALGSDHVDVARTLNSLAAVHDLKGDPETARNLFRRSIAIKIRVLGPGNPDVATSVMNLGASYAMAGQSQEALPHFQRALEIRLRAFEADHPSVAGAQENLGRLYYELGQTEPARQFLERALASREKRLGGEHPRIPGILNILARVAQLDDDLDEAESLLRRSLAIRERILEPGHADTESARTQLQELLAKNTLEGLR